MRYHADRLLLVLLAIQASALYSQSKADQDLIKQARSLYYIRGSRPAYIACDSTLDWEDLAKEVNLPQTEARQRGLELAKAMKTSFATRGSSATQVTVQGDPRLAKQEKMLEQQIAGFFQAYWGLADGRIFPDHKQSYGVASSPQGYVVTLSLEDGMTGTLTMDTSFLVTKLVAKGHPTELEITPRFTREDDGLLHLIGMSYERRFGESRSLWEYSFDYQSAGGYYVPEHVTMSMPGAVSYKHTFSNCQALDKANEPESVPGSPDK